MQVLIAPGLDEKMLHAMQSKVGTQSWLKLISRMQRNEKEETEYCEQ